MSHVDARPNAVPTTVCPPLSVLVPKPQVSRVLCIKTQSHYDRYESPNCSCLQFFVQIGRHVTWLLQSMTPLV